jgi:hypothetical protein
MSREVTDREGTTWNCVQAYAELAKIDEDKAQEAARVKGKEDLVEVVATPSGGAQTVRLELKSDWEEKASDEEILDKLKERL